MTELKPCGCGSPARLDVKKGFTRVAGAKWYREYVHCKKKSCGIQTKVCKRPGQAVKIWNQRSNETLQAEVEKLKTREGELLLIIGEALGRLDDLLPALQWKLIEHKTICEIISDTQKALKGASDD